MASAWEHFGEVANVVQLTGLNAVALVSLIVKAANRARMHKQNCQKFALHVKMIGNLLEQLKISELKKYPETREPLEMLEDALRRAYVLVNSCQERSYLYLIAMGWNIVYQFRRAQEEIDRYLRIIPLIALLDNARVKERLEEIQKDQREYTYDEEDRKVQNAILNPQPSEDDTIILKKSLSCTYPKLPFDTALRKENEKLKLELQRSQAHLDVAQCEVIQQLIEVTEKTADPPSEYASPVKSSQKLELGKAKKPFEKNTEKVHRQTSSRRGASTVESNLQEEWHADLLGCCAEPYLCVKTFLCPCKAFSKISSVATGKQMSSAEVCNEIMAYSLILACCCYTCCVRRKLRRTFNIKGGLFDDFLSHFMCCCCALVQELREVEIRGAYGTQNTRTSPPPCQHMES
ncbi:protein MID1-COMPLEMENTING ACTIVITY 1-like isoform X1 [Olea europaea var. sylvestris]|uniref:protein MID1-COMPLEMENTING ACTIVITY 1-like isoform X1 n=1 Tax=Olea europaea var. sylvestris TaxID=158386 RepID=UPI000C1D0EB7|nr:protein MID1-COMPLEMENTING ACTIVITY 1-like isoform X1 [Olea europaea var. sylvestris]